MQFSVIIPLRDKGPHIERALRSVYRQTYRDYEVVVVDDASTDDGLDVVRRIQDMNTRLVCRNRSGPGGYAARNDGIRIAINPWIAFLDADDEWLPDHLKNLVGLTTRWPDVLCLASAYERDYGDGAPRLCSYATRFGGFHARRIGFAEYVRETARDRCPVWTSAVAVHREAVIRAGLFPDGRCTRGGDVDTWLRIAELTDIGWSSAVGARYHRDSVNMVTRQIPPQLCHCVDETIVDMIRRKPAGGRLASAPATALKRVANYYKKPAFKRAVRSGEIRVRDVRHLYFWADPLYVTVIMLAAAAPNSLLAALIRTLRLREAPTVDCVAASNEKSPRHLFPGQRRG